MVARMWFSVIQSSHSPIKCRDDEWDVQSAKQRGDLPTLPSQDNDISQHQTTQTQKYFPKKFFLHRWVRGEKCYLLLWRGSCHGGLVHQGLGAVPEEAPAAHQGERGWHFLQEGDSLTSGLPIQLHPIHLQDGSTKRIKGYPIDWFNFFALFWYVFFSYLSVKVWFYLGILAQLAYFINRFLFFCKNSFKKALFL